MKRALACTYRDLLQHHILQVSAALSYYLVLSVFPALIFLSAIVGFISVPDLFGHVLSLMGRLLPADTMKVVYSGTRGRTLLAPRNLAFVRHAGHALDNLGGV